MDNFPLGIKVCGMREPNNIRQLMTLKPDWIGFIFYPKSPRFVGEEFDTTASQLASGAKKTGVFVNQTIDYIQSKIERYSLNALQLHGSESSEMCATLKSQGVTIIKAFSVDESLDFAPMQSYVDHVDYFLFDTKTSGHGGSGQKFDWQLLTNYPYSKPFFLSGGIDESDASTIIKLNIPQLACIDLNSKFEISPGVKNIEMLKTFLNQLQQYQTVKSHHTNHI